VGVEHLFIRGVSRHLALLRAAPGYALARLQFRWRRRWNDDLHHLPGAPTLLFIPLGDVVKASGSATRRGP